MTAPFPALIVSEPDHVTVAGLLMLMVRAERNLLLLEVMLSAAFIFVVPLPLMVPADQLSVPFVVSTPGPVTVPLRSNWFAVNVLPLPVVTIPALVNGLVREKFRPFVIVKLPATKLLLKLFSASVALSLVCMTVLLPSRMIVAALFTI